MPSLRLTIAGEPGTDILSSSDVTVVALYGLLPYNYIKIIIINNLNLNLISYHHTLSKLFLCGNPERMSYKMESTRLLSTSEPLIF